MRGNPMKNLTFAVLGGDARQFSLADMLAKKGAEVRAYGLPAEKLSNEVSVLSDWREAVAG
ncbi:MAG: dipicolinic acid synthetase subunit A, partial [Clostridia bacterium]|nr:dipicolinic acid synthetase subunit A [Clostridia bacterium]